MPEQLRYCSFFTSQPENWGPCSKEHHDMVKANPQEWPGYEVRELREIPADQVLVPRELLKRVTSYAETLYDREQRAKGIEELRALLQP